MLRSSRGVRLAAVLSVIIAASVTGCGAEQTGAPASESAGPIEAFKNSVYADMAGDEHHVWALVAGHDASDAPLGMRIYERARLRGWRELPSVPWTTHARGALAIAGWHGRPCVAVPRRERGSGDAGLCLSSNGWRSISDASAIDGQTIRQLTSYRGALLTIVTRSEQGTRLTNHTIYRWAGQKWRRVGSPIRARSGIPALGRTGEASAAPDLLIESTGAKPPTRTIYRFADGEWTPAVDPIERATIGPNVSGPVTRDGTTWVAVTEASRTPWRFSVLQRRSNETGRWQRRTLNSGRGNAQGGVYPGHSGVWAIWVESLPLKSGPVPFTEQIWAARLDRDEIRPVSLHSGPSVGPGDLTVVDAAGATWALYMSTTRNQGMRTFVRALPDDARP